MNNAIFAPGHIVVAHVDSHQRVGAAATHTIVGVLVRQRGDGTWMVARLTTRATYGTAERPGPARQVLTSWAACQLKSPSFIASSTLRPINGHDISHSVGVVDTTAVLELDDAIGFRPDELLALHTAARLAHGEHTDDGQPSPQQMNVPMDGTGELAATLEIDETPISGYTPAATTPPTQGVHGMRTRKTATVGDVVTVHRPNPTPGADGRLHPLLGAIIAEHGDGTVEVAAITDKAVDRNGVERTPITEWRQCGLLRASYVTGADTTTVERANIARRFGTLTIDAVDDLNEAIELYDDELDALDAAAAAAHEHRDAA